MHSFHSIVLNVPISCKDEFTHALENFTWTENEVMIRIGIHSVQILRQGLFHSESSSLKEEYEHQLEGKEKERQMFERIMLENQTKWIDSQVTQQLQLFKANAKTLETEKQKQMDCYEKQVHVEREKMQHRYDEMVRRNDELQQQVYVMERANLHKIEEDRAILRAEQESTYQKYQVELLKNKEEIIRLKENKALDELTVQNQINSHIQHENARINKLQDQLLRTSEELCHIRLTNETSKVEALSSAMEIHRREFEEIRETLQTSKHSSSCLGKIGENYFHELAEETFGSYDGFELLDKTKTAHSGDFHLQFKDFTVLVDTKNFIKGRISTTDVNKFKFDMTRNGSVQVGWLISLQGCISNYGKRPYTFEVEDGRLLVYINDLQNVSDPVKMLQDIWYITCFLYNQLLNIESNTDVLSSYKRYEKRMKDSLEKLQKMSKKTIATMNQLREDVLETKKILKEVINEVNMLPRLKHGGIQTLCHLLMPK